MVSKEKSTVPRNQCLKCFCGLATSLFWISWELKGSGCLKGLSFSHWGHDTSLRGGFRLLSPKDLPPNLHWHQCPDVSQWSWRQKPTQKRIQNPQNLQKEYRNLHRKELERTEATENQGNSDDNHSKGNKDKRYKWVREQTHSSNIEYIWRKTAFK